PNFQRYVETYLKPQVKELLTNYGPIGIMWFDGEWIKDWTPENGQDMYAWCRSIQPKVIVNNRVGKARAGMNGMNQGEGAVGDYGTPEQEIPATGFPGVDWESCMTMNNTWGYKQNDHDWKPAQTLIRNLIDCASKGGNYLLNVGPTGEGMIPETSVERLQKIGAWTKVNGVAIYGTTASPFTKQLPWGRCTTKVSGDTTTLYLHVFDWPTDGELLVPGLMNSVSSATLLATGQKLPVAPREDGLLISVPSAAPDKISSTIVLQFKGAPDIVVTPLLQKPDGSIALPASEADLHGDTFKYESGSSLDDIGYWTNPGDWADWNFKVNRPGKFTVSAVIAAPASGAFDVAVAGQTLHCSAPVTGNYVTFEPVNLGTIEITGTGEMTLAVHPVKDGWQPMNLKSILIKPTAP
ncbi:MAG TPA: alpha-L-fucosidase, partial [Candidatus Binatia bacterium]|nr:alpha-L-fucosidase [Candidatus Binatia bacterium]